MLKDYYKILGLDRKSSADSIKQRFRELAFENHPDVSDNKDATDAFIEIYEAYYILSDPDRKEGYDLMYDKYVRNMTLQIQDEESIKTVIKNSSCTARERASQKAKVTYRDFMKEMDCFFSPGEKADGKPFYYGMHRNIGISGGTGPMGSIKAKSVRIPIPRSRRAYLLHRIGFSIKALFLIIGIVVLKFDLISTADIYSKIAILPASMLTGAIITYSIYRLKKTRSKFFHARKFILIKKYRKKGYKRGGHPMISTTPVGPVIFLLRLIF